MELVAKLRHMGRQYATGQAARGGGQQKHYLEDAADEIEALRTLVIASRSSVKFDLQHYEKMARAYGNLGNEGAQTRAAAEAEAHRLHALLEKIDALALATPNDPS